ncbi:MAG: hypothetical protein WA936_09320 [Erythrobacter sp.]|uniref:hypothetical protein n=1 Tax=Erythrobacter sp. TaxID=1042 RepID=UPI003C72F250
MVAGLGAFAAGAMLAATGERAVGIALMALGLLLQVVTLRQLKKYKKKGSIDAGR